MGKLIDLTGMRFGKLLVVEQAESAPDNSARWLCRCDCGNEFIARSRSLRDGSVVNCGCERPRYYDLTGQRFGKLLVIRKESENSNSGTRWLCRCDCGNECVKRSSALRNGSAVDCGCESSLLIDLTGQIFGKLTVVEKLPTEADRRTRWLCRCECGNMCIVLSRALRKGQQKSCGCGRRKDLAGKRFGNLTAIERSDKFIEVDGRGKKYLWKCVCDCGEIVYRLPEKLRDNTNSACEYCLEKRKVAAMVQSAGFIEGTQLKKIASTKALVTSTSGVRGVFFNKRTQKWRAMLKCQGVNHYLGEYKELADAVKARSRAEEQYFEPLLKKYKII